MELTQTTTKSSLPVADRHDEFVTPWDDYPKFEIPPAFRQAGIANENQL